jgi:hypothetical protein
LLAVLAELPARALHAPEISISVVVNVGLLASFDLFALAFIARCKCRWRRYDGESKQKDGGSHGLPDDGLIGPGVRKAFPRPAILALLGV